jgi:photosystem II stability/assembly factor-like uncharacterized protein
VNRLGAKWSLVLLLLAPSHQDSRGAEWERQASGTQGDLAAVHFADVEVGYAAGFLTVVRTLDGGVTWQPLSLPTNAAFLSVFAKSATEVFVGRQSLFHSVNGGASWRRIEFPEAPSGSIFDVKFSSDTTGFLVKLGKVFKTVNRGETWTLAFPGGGLYLSNIEVVGSQTIYSTGGITYDGLTRADFVRSYDGGTTWEVVQPGGLSEIMASAWVGPREGYVFTFSQQVLKTSDGGDSWVPVNDTLGELVLDACFIDAQSGFALCYSGNILSTTNSGVSWDVYRASDEPLNAIARPCGGTCYAVGSGGRIFKRTTGQGRSEEVRIAALDYLTGTGGLVLRLHGSPCKRYRIEVTHDLSWWEPVAECVPEAEDWHVNLEAGLAPIGFFRIVQVQN